LKNELKEKNSNSKKVSLFLLKVNYLNTFLFAILFSIISYRNIWDRNLFIYFYRVEELYLVSNVKPIVPLDVLKIYEGRNAKN